MWFARRQALSIPHAMRATLSARSRLGTQQLDAGLLVETVHEAFHSHRGGHRDAGTLGRLQLGGRRTALASADRRCAQHLP